MDLKKCVRDIPGFPKEGIIFKDITTLLRDGKAFAEAVDKIADSYKGKSIDAVLSVEARGFTFGAAVAYKLGVGLIPVRKKGKLPYKTHSVTYDLEYGKDTLEIHEHAFKKGDHVLIVDDLLATGGTTAAVASLVKKMGGEIVGIAFVIELLPLKGRDKLKSYEVTSLIKDEYC
ncbi:MAG: adenine phosphoribosyltransferase [Candidatus Omnitrophica bacterium]|nr:adenine phosphoribosyltransferase [Candidatus Omnitrophota bacterium]